MEFLFFFLLPTKATFKDLLPNVKLLDQTKMMELPLLAADKRSRRDQLLESLSFSQFFWPRPQWYCMQNRRWLMISNRNLGSTTVVLWTLSRFFSSSTRRSKEIIAFPYDGIKTWTNAWQADRFDMEHFLQCVSIRHSIKSLDEGPTEYACSRGGG